MKLNNKLIDHFKNNRSKINNLCLGLCIAYLAIIVVKCLIVGIGIVIGNVVIESLFMLFYYPIIILTIFIAIYNKEYKKQAMLPVIFGINMLCSLAKAYLYRWTVISIFYFAFLLIDGYIFFLSLRGFNILKGKMTLQIYYFIIIIFELVGSIESICSYLEYYDYSAIVSLIFSLIIKILWNMICILFISTNKFKDFIKEGKIKKQNKKNVDQEINNVEKELKVLKEKYELGCIEEEEYKLRREEIINRVLQ